MLEKIAFEEHFNIPEMDEDVPPYVRPEVMAEIKAKLLDVSEMRLHEMDAAGIAYSLLSMTAPLTEVGVDHVLFSTDYPYESMRVASDWYDAADISASDRVKISQANARRLFPNLPAKLGDPAAATQA